MSSTARRRRQVPLLAEFWRGGTSKGVFLERKNLPDKREDWAPLLRGLMGSPDSYGRQLNGMGGGISSLSKVIVVEPSTRKDADVDFTFIQIGIRDDTVDYASNCGNLSSAVGPYAYDHGLVDVKPDKEGRATVCAFNTNTNKRINVSFDVDVEDEFYRPEGDFSIDGVSGTASQITLDFLNPGGSRTGKLFPTGNAIDKLTVDGRTIDVSLIDCANPCQFVRAADVGVPPNISPDAILAHPDLLRRLEAIRRVGTVAMGMASTTEEAARLLSVPKICMVAATKDKTADLIIRCISSGDPHRAVPMTVALNIAAAARMRGNIVRECVKKGERSVDLLGTTIAHPSGRLLVSATVERPDGVYEVEAGRVYRTARLLFEGTVYANV